MIIDLKMENYQEILNSDKVVILDFYMIPCGPCESMLIVLEKIDKKYKDAVIIAKVNALNDDFQDLIFDYSVRGVPTFVILKNAKVVQKFVGYTDMEKIEKIIDQYL
jgi:thioredoxin 1